MTGMELLTLALWGGGGFAAPVVMSRVFRQSTIDVADEEAVLVTSHGKLVDTLKTPGLHMYPARIFPWVKLHRVSLARDFREIENIHVNDASGHTRSVDKERLATLAGSLSCGTSSRASALSVATTTKETTADASTARSDLGRRSQ